MEDSHVKDSTRKGRGSTYLRSFSLAVVERQSRRPKQFLSPPLIRDDSSSSFSRRLRIFERELTITRRDVKRFFSITQLHLRCKNIDARTRWPWPATTVGYCIRIKCVPTLVSCLDDGWHPLTPLSCIS